MLNKKMELHVHTKMSRMRGLISPKELVEFAIENKYDTIVVADLGSVQAFPEIYNTWKKYRNEFGGRYGKIEEVFGDGHFLKIIYGMEVYLAEDSKQAVQKSDKQCYPILLYARNEEGIRNLYKLISSANRDEKTGLIEINRSLLQEKREGLLVGAVCDQGELSECIRLGGSDEELKEIAAFYDFIEITPYCECVAIDDTGKVIFSTDDDIKEMLGRLFFIGKDACIPVVLASDAYYLSPEDKISCDILREADFSVKLANDDPVNRHSDVCFSGCRSAHIKGELEFKDTISAIQYGTGNDVAGDVEQYLAESMEKIDGLVEQVSPLREGRFLPKYPDAEDTLEKICYEKAHELYGKLLPDEVEERLKKEVDPICRNGFAGIFMLWRELAQKSISDGCLVGTRGSVASSFVAYLLGITMINPLDAHYRCEKCGYSLFKVNDELESLSRGIVGAAGADLPGKKCPVCGEELVRDGFSIPAETFMAVRFDKEPDIDLNFAPSEQPVIQKYVLSLPGVREACKAGTIAGFSERTASDMIKRYYNNFGEEMPDKIKMEKMVSQICGVKRADGEHPGGIVVVPEGEELTSFTPLNHGRGLSGSSTHFDYHSIDNNLLKLDILAHDDPEMLKELHEMTGKDPGEVPINDEKVMSLFLGTEALGIVPQQIGGETLGVLGVPEYSGGYVRHVLKKLKPTSLTQLIKISGLMHGTDVWFDNAEELIESGIASIDECIGTRDDIMLYLLAHGFERDEAFRIMEAVRKGRGISEEWMYEMRKRDIPDWYIESCSKIRYLFPKAHAASYTKMALMIAWYKVYYPAEFYTAWLKIKGKWAEGTETLPDPEGVEAMIDEYEETDHLKYSGTSELERLYVLREMYARMEKAECDSIIRNSTEK